jgi:acetylornithine/succinyldiaminopimelate/putrescine aminotransferase
LPPLTVASSEIDEAIDRLDRACVALEKAAKSKPMA